MSLSEKIIRPVPGLRFYGRMSLTDYISQSVPGALIYSPFGLSLAPYCGYAAGLPIGGDGRAVSERLAASLRFAICFERTCFVFPFVSAGAAKLLRIVRF